MTMWMIKDTYKHSKWLFFYENKIIIGSKALKS